MSLELVMLSNHLILCHPLLLLPSVFPSIRVFPKMSLLFASGGQSIGASILESVLPLNIQGWFLLGLTDLISLVSTLDLTNFTIALFNASSSILGVRQHAIGVGWEHSMGAQGQKPWLLLLAGWLSNLEQLLGLSFVTGWKGRMLPALSLSGVIGRGKPMSQWVWKALGVVQCSSPNEDYDDGDDASKGHCFNRFYTSRKYVLWFFL